MQRWVTTLVGVAVVGLALWLVFRNFQPPRAIGKDPTPVSSTVAGGDPKAFVTGDAGPGDGGPPLLLSDLIQAEPRMDGGVGATMLDGTPVPPLPLTVPRSVRFGVVLVSYEGAQPSPTAGRTSSRPKSDAKVLAQHLATVGQQDFHAAVQQGDAGSTDDIGRVKLGILEPAPEYVLFTLPIDGVGGPIDTPRGYWIVKRLE
jgi:hypothetical protein